MTEQRPPRAEPGFDEIRHVCAGQCSVVCTGWRGLGEDRTLDAHDPVLVHRRPHPQEIERMVRNGQAGHPQDFFAIDEKLLPAARRYDPEELRARRHALVAVRVARFT
ncbi:hypothetical protein NI18_08915 [Sphingomonas sp. Ant20]|nr:hypothetical protein NI18_08915 [Sphingomonas sp. Ant20]